MINPRNIVMKHLVGARVPNIKVDRYGKNNKNKEIRTFDIDKNGIMRNYKAIQGTVWRSGWDERIDDELPQNITPGKYEVSFYPIGNGDAISDVKFKKLR